MFTNSVCFYILGSSATSPGLEGVAVCRRCPVGPRSTILPGHQISFLQGWAPCTLLLWQGYVAVGTLVDRAGPWPGWLQGPAATAAGMLVGGVIVLSVPRPN